MKLRTLKPDKGTSYFCTFTNCNWIPLFQITNFYDKIYSWFDFLVNRGDQIIGYVIMPNHMHAIIYLNKNSPIINKVIGEAKRLFSYSIVSKLKKLDEGEIILQLQNCVSDYERKKGFKHKVFEDSFDCKECYNYNYILQKLQYMHLNPVKAGLIITPEEYIHSSAKYYSTGEQGIYPVKHFVEVFEGKEAFEFSRKYFFK